MRTIALLILLAGASLDVKTESSRFTITQNGKKVGTEEFSITARKGGGYIAEGSTKLNSESSAIKSRMELDEQLRPISYEYRRGAGVIRMKIDKPLSEYETGTGDKLTSINFRFPENGFIVDNNFFHHIQLLLYKLDRKGGEATIVVPQDMNLGAVTVTPRDKQTFDLQMGDVKMEATIDPFDGRLLRLAAPAAKVVVER
jgi:hypothetical protein